MGSMIWWVLFTILAFLNPMQFPLNYALVQIALVIPAIIAGYRFYVVGFRAIWQRSPMACRQLVIIQYIINFRVIHQRPL